MFFFGGKKTRRSSSSAQHKGNRKLQSPSGPPPPQRPRRPQQGPPSPPRQQPSHPQSLPPFPSPHPFQQPIAGYLTAPPGMAAVPPTSPYQQQYASPIVVNQYYLNHPSSQQQHQQQQQYPPSGQPHPTGPPRLSKKPNQPCSLSKITGSTVTLVNDMLPGNLPINPQAPQQLFDDGVAPCRAYGTQVLNQSAALYDQISSTLNDVLTSIDQNRLQGHERELFHYHRIGNELSLIAPSSVAAPTTTSTRGRPPAPVKKGKKEKQANAVATSVISGTYFAKVDLYANSKLPLNLPPLRLYLPTYLLLSLAAQYSERAYEKPRGPERSAHVDADWKTGSKAMVIKSVPMDHMNTIVFAIRGTATFMDWAVNLNMSPTSPVGFLDDPGNLCHTGFLAAARRMIAPVAARLRGLLVEDPYRRHYSLLMTGHSAGGAIASLLYSHMVSRSEGVRSELTALAGAFRRVHCVTFGTPPVSLLPLGKPEGLPSGVAEEVAGGRKGREQQQRERQRQDKMKKWLFMSFVNEGDPVVRADKEYVKSLLELFAAPAPGNGVAIEGKKSGSGSGSGGKKGSGSSKTSKKKDSNNGGEVGPTATRGGGELMPTWKIPPCTLSCPGRIVVLRSGNPRARVKGKKTVEERLDEGVVAQVAGDEDLRGVVWGDPVCHVMRLYAGRIETLAAAAITGAGHR